MNDSGFDKRLRDKLDGYQQPFREGAWDNMAAILDEEKPRRRKGVFWWIFGSAIGLALLSWVAVDQFNVSDGGTINTKNHPQDEQVVMPAADSETVESNKGRVESQFQLSQRRNDLKNAAHRSKSLVGTSTTERKDNSAGFDKQLQITGNEKRAHTRMDNEHLFNGNHVMENDAIARAMTEEKNQLYTGAELSTIKENTTYNVDEAIEDRSNVRVVQEYIGTIARINDVQLLERQRESLDQITLNFSDSERNSKWSLAVKAGAGTWMQEINGNRNVVYASAFELRRHFKGRWFAGIAASLDWHRSTFYEVGNEPAERFDLGTGVINQSFTPTNFITLSTPISAGYAPLRWLEVYGGIGLQYAMAVKGIKRASESFEVYQLADPNLRPNTRESKRDIWYADDSMKDFNLYAHLGGSIELINQLWLDIEWNYYPHGIMRLAENNGEADLYEKNRHLIKVSAKYLLK